MNGVRERRAENHVELVPHLHGQNGPTHLAQSTGFGVSFELSEVPHQGQSEATVATNATQNRVSSM